MGEARFTPGPWIADDFCEENDRRTRVGTYDGTPTYYHRTTTIAYCQTNFGDDLDDNGPEIGIVAAEANANLIAAAPELYSALSDIMENPSYQTAIGGNPDMVERLLARARAALRKARGEPQSGERSND